MSELEEQVNKLAADTFTRIGELGMENATVGKFMELKAKKNKDKVAILFEEQKITYNELDRRSNSIANGLSQMG